MGTPSSRTPLSTATDNDEFSLAAVSVKSIMTATRPEENITIRPFDVISVPVADIIYRGLIIRHHSSDTGGRPAAQGAKYPTMSMIRSVGFPASTVIAAPVPAGTMAAFAITNPSGELSVDTPG